MSKKFESQFFTTVDDLISTKTALEGDMLQRRRRQKIIRQFSNGLATMSHEEAQTVGSSEIVNHLTTFKFLLQRKKRLQQAFTTTRSFIEIKVDTDNPEWDSQQSLRLTTAMNKGCVYHPSGEFSGFLNGLAGEAQIGGGAPVMHHKLGGWAPKLALNMLFPKKSPMVASEISYAFAPEELNLSDLENLIGAIKGEDGISTSKKAVQALINVLKKKPKGEATSNVGGSNIDQNQSEKIGSSIDEADSNRNATVDVWWYYEVKDDGDGIPYVSGTMFNQRINLDSKDPGGEVGPQVICYFKKLFKSPDDWLHLICMDMEIGGDTTLDSVRGIAEIMYPSSSEIETLLNLMISGDKIRAKPKYQITSKAASDDVLAWDDENENIVPEGVASFDMKGSSSPLLTNMQLLMGNVAGLGSGEISNSRGGGELRQQAVGRQADNATMQFGDMSDWVRQLEGVATTCVERVFVGNARKGCRGYHQIMWVRACMERYKIPLKKLFLKEHGQFKYISVRVRRTLGDGGFDSEQSSSDFLMAISPKLPPQNRALVLKMAIATRTQDPDLADELVKVPQPIINAQKLTAENECDTIMRRALLGMPITTNQDDVDQDHIPVHMLDMIAKISQHQLRPWDKMDVIGFAGLQRHAQDHLENILGDKDVRDEGLAFLPQFQQIVEAAQKIAAEVEQREGQATNEQELSPLEQETIRLKTLELQLKAQQLGVSIENNQSLERQRLARMQQTSRSNYVREIGEASRLTTERRRMELEEQKSQAQINKMRADTYATMNPPAKPTAP